MGLATLSLRRKPLAQDEFLRRWGELLTEQQRRLIVDAYGQRVDRIADVALAVRMKNGDVEILTVPGA